MPSYVGVGFSSNSVTEIEGSYNGQADDTPSDYNVKIDWGDGAGADTTSQLVAGGIRGSVGYVLVKGTHTCKQQGTCDVTVYVTGPDGQTISDTTATVAPNPNAITLGSLSPTEWAVNEDDYDGTISFTGGTGDTRTCK